MTVFERAGRIGGLLMYGIPNMKLDKDVVSRRVGLMEEEGIDFRTGVTVGADIAADELQAEFDAVVLATGATVARDLAIPGRELGGIHLAMSYLRGNTRRLLDGGADAEAPIDAAGKDVLVIGGGDTGTDCVGTAIRQGARSVRQLELLGQPPLERAANNPWPEWPKVYKLDYGQEEAQALWGEDPRRYSTTTRRFIGRNEHVTGVEIADLSWQTGPDGKVAMREVPGTAQVLAGGPRAAGARVPRAGAGAAEGVRLRARPARQRPHRRRQDDERARRVRRRRLLARPVARRVGDPRGTDRRRGRRPVPRPPLGRAPSVRSSGAACAARWPGIVFAGPRSGSRCRMIIRLPSSSRSWATVPSRTESSISGPAASEIAQAAR